MTQNQQRILLGASIGIVIAVVALILGGAFDGLFRKMAGETAQPPASTTLTAAPATPESEAEKTADGKQVIPIFDLVRVEPSGEAVIAGQSAPGAAVEILSNQDVVAKGAANENGEWAIVLEAPLPTGAHDITARATTGDGTALTSEQSVAVEVPAGADEDVLVVLNEPGAPSTVLQKPEEEAQAVAPAATAPTATTSLVSDPPQAPALPDLIAIPAPPVVPGSQPVVIVTATEASPSAPSLSTPETGTPTAPAAQTPVVPPVETKAPSDAAEPAPRPVTIEAVELENGKAFFAAGAGVPQAVVRLYVNDVLISETQTMETGRWLVQTEHALAAGDHRVRADHIDATGAVITRAEVPFLIAEEAPNPPTTVAAGGAALAGSGTAGTARVGAAQTLIIRRGDNLWRIARRLYGRGIRYSTIYQANSEQIVDPDLIYPGQVFVIPQGDRNWQDVEVN